MMATNAIESETAPLLTANESDVEPTLSSSTTQKSKTDRRSNANAYTPLPRPIYVIFLLCTVTPLAFELIFPFVSESLA